MDDGIELMAQSISRIIYGSEYATPGRIGEVTEWLRENYDEDDDPTGEELAEMFTESMEEFATDEPFMCF